MINFILNNQEIKTEQPTGMLLLDFIRYHKNLKGTKIGCREGDCGACTVLIGELKNSKLTYRSVTSCLMPIGNVNGKHVVTVEGVNLEKLSPIQQALYDESATQCGFCTVGIVMSLTGFCLNYSKNNNDVIGAIDGNICRCTGYKSIEKAAIKIEKNLELFAGMSNIEFLVKQQYIPEYFINIESRLNELSVSNKETKNTKLIVAGGTDLYVQKHDELHHSDINFISDESQLNGISERDGFCYIGAATKITELIDSPIFTSHFPKFYSFAKLVSSTPIRNMATLGGNFTNASPIGDFTIFFLALNAKLILDDGKNSRELSLKEYYLGYKKLNKNTNEYIRTIFFELPKNDYYFNFEKVSKRKNLDIASVNTAILLKFNDQIITEAAISVGGVGPIPMLLLKASSYLINKKLNEEIISECIIIAQTEISPISDTRGSSEYKILLLSQLIKAHFNNLL